jgi:hypothetical protein
MKLNFWQWLGVALLILGVIWTIYHRRKPATTRPSSLAPAPVTPAALHACIMPACPTNSIL